VTRIDAPASHGHPSAVRKLARLVVDPLFLNSSSLVAARSIAGAARVGILLAIARTYGSAKFGELSLVISMVEILRTFSEFGVDTISIRKFAQAPAEQRTDLLGGIIGAKFLMATLFYCVGAAVLLAITKARIELQLGAIAGLSLFFVGGLGSISSYLQSYFSMAKVFRTTLLASFVSIGFATIAILNRASLLWVIAAFPLGDGVNLLLLSFKLNAPFRVSIRETISLLRESLPVGLSVSSVVLYFRLDNLFIFKFAGEAALGLYAVCYRMVEPALLIPYSFSTTSYTFLSGAEHQQAGVQKVTRILLRSMWPAYLFTAAVAAVVFAVGKPLMARFFPGYQAAYPILLVLVLTLCVRTMNATSLAVLNSRAKFSLLAKITGINLAVNLIFVVMFVPRWGALGAAWAAFFTEVVNGFMLGLSAFSSLHPAKPFLMAETAGTD
jgi:O-antigen/teichoic acid export membrane protein